MANTKLIQWHFWSFLISMVFQVLFNITSIFHIYYGVLFCLYLGLLCVPMCVSLCLLVFLVRFLWRISFCLLVLSYSSFCLYRILVLFLDVYLFSNENERKSVELDGKGCNPKVLPNLKISRLYNTSWKKKSQPAHLKAYLCL